MKDSGSFLLCLLKVFSVRDAHVFGGIGRRRARANRGIVTRVDVRVGRRARPGVTAAQDVTDTLRASEIAALVIILFETLMGLFLMETLRFTSLFPLGTAATIQPNVESGAVPKLPLEPNPDG